MIPKAVPYGAMLLLALSVAVMLPVTGETAADDDSDSPEAVIRSLVRANAEKDLATLEKTMAIDPEAIGYSIGGRKFVGWDGIAQAFQQEFAMVERLDIPIKELHVWRHGDVAWFAMELDYIRHLGKDQVVTLPLRETGVLKRQAGRWTLVGWHESLRGQIQNRNRTPGPQQ